MFQPMLKSTAGARGYSRCQGTAGARGYSRCQRVQPVPEGTAGARGYSLASISATRVSSVGLHRRGSVPINS
ncbi:hypothetical protein VFPPC_17458 [Pochonia chlamydosporia 170]|uniref:Uncharacterized protein n=1 Tax=Pochonia chlamydosporia 170 TaxID=1380566 RepID=A0A219AS08_METCM|nr:hypothetical protein VFPPC_17458 [Pochonia chlamydosporia 170]OWT43379.1 hypothetical protein VFPPC_17458 [Pochonia chlamydosporia 170]